MMLLLLAQRQEPAEWVKWIGVALFFGFPLIARLLKALQERVGGKREAAAPAEPGARRRVREQQRQGEELWRRLARGEVSAPPPAAAPMVLSRPAPRTVLAPVLGESSEVSLESEEAPQPLSVLGDVSEPSEAPESSLEGESEPAPLAVLGAQARDEGVPWSRAAFVLSHADLRRAIVLSEVLGPPVSERALRA